MTKLALFFGMTLVKVNGLNAVQGACGKHVMMSGRFCVFWGLSKALFMNPHLS